MEEKLPQYPDIVISYADTTLYSFAGKNFFLKGQHTLIHLTFGNEEPTYKQQKVKSVTEGLYEVNASDSSKFLNIIL